jgi:hypothetical protein
MVDELERWRTAQQLIKQHGPQATLNAAVKASEAIAAGDLEGESLWKDVINKIQQLQRAKLPPEVRN